MEQRISELSAVTNPDRQDFVPVVNEGSTKKITMAQLVESSLPDAIEANVAIRSDAQQVIDSYVLPLGQLAYVTDERTLRVGDGINLGGVQVQSKTRMQKRLTRTTRTAGLSYDEADLDETLALTIGCSDEGGCQYRGSCRALFLSQASSPIAYVYGWDSMLSPVISMGMYQIEQCGPNNAPKKSYDKRMESVWFPGFEFICGSPVVWIDAPGEQHAFVYESEFFFSLNQGDSITVGCGWGSNDGGGIFICEGSLIEVQRTK